MRKTGMEQEEVLALLVDDLKSRGARFEKFKKVFASQSQGGELVQTITKDGKETEQMTKPGDFIVQNQTDAQERYVMPAENFKKRYKPLPAKTSDDLREYLPTGKIIAIELTPELLKEKSLPKRFNFYAAWGEKMVAKQGDFLACPMDFAEIYRIAKKEFFETYQPVQG